MALTLEQQRAVAMANARARIAQSEGQQAPGFDFSALKAEGPTYGRGGPPQRFIPSGERPEPSFADPEMLAAHPLTRFAVGAAEPFIGAAQLAANAVGAGEPVNRHFQQLDKMTQEGRSEGGSEGVDWWKLGGNVASPATLYAGGSVANAATKPGRILQGAKVGGAFGAAQPVYDPERYWGTKALQTGTGAGMGAAVPAAWEGGKAIGRGVRNIFQPHMGERGADLAAGRMANITAGDKRAAVIAELKKSRPLVPGSEPTAGQASVAANSSEFAALQDITAGRAPSTYYGPQGIEGQQNAARLAAVRRVGQTPEALKAAEGSRATDAATNYERALKTEALRPPQEKESALSISQFVAKHGGLKRDLVGGDLNTDYVNLPPGLSAKGLGLAKLQHNGPTAKTPDSMRELLTDAGYLGENNSLNDMYTMLGDEVAAGQKMVFSTNEIDSALAARAASQVPVNPVLIELSSRPAFLQAVERAKQLALEEGAQIGDPTNSVKGLHYVKLALDDSLQKGRSPQSGMGGVELRAVEATRKKLLAMLDEVSPAYKIARETYAAQSRPINQMEVGQELERQLVPALSADAKQRATAYANALRNAPQTIKRATGHPRFETLEQVMEPGQLETLRSVHGDLANDAAYKALASSGSAEAGRRVAGVVTDAPPSGMFSPFISVARGLYNRAAGESTDRIISQLAKRMQSPQDMARLMETATPFERKALVDALMRGEAAVAPGVLGAATSSALGDKRRRQLVNSLSSK